MDPSDVTIPRSLLPADGRFGCGPTKVRPEAVARLVAVGKTLLGTSHRREPVRAQVGRLQSGLRDLFRLPDDYEVLLANGGATTFWDMAAFGLIRDRSAHYVFGEFSSKFAAAARAAPWLEDPVEVEAEPGTRPDPRPIEGVDVQALTHNETSTGVMMDLVRPDDALVVVDATSAAAGLPVDPAAFDVYYFSLQKGLASEGGLVVALLSPAAVERIGELAPAAERYVPTSLALSVALDNSRQRQTYNTPAITTLFLAAEQVDWLNGKGGLRWAVSSCRDKAEHVYTWAEERPWAAPFVADPAARSHVVATVDLDGVSADNVNAVLRRHGVIDTESYRKLGRNQLRIGLFPAVDHADVEAYTACVDHVVEQLS
ncbi:MAG: phosphoserine transaminase [Actinobacteria bacterium]|nr:phosphoserine transaminase [Actinomycetota bacterium]